MKQIWKPDAETRTLKLAFKTVILNVETRILCVVYNNKITCDGLASLSHIVCKVYL